MKKEALYNDTVNIILDAYNEGKLEVGCSCGCFIGNIVRKRCTNLVVSPVSNTYNAEWYSTMMYADHYNKEGLRQLASTGYSIREVRILEEAFESAGRMAAIKEFGHDLFPTGHDPRVQLAAMKAALTKLAKIHETMPDDSIERLETIHNKLHESESRTTDAGRILRNIREGQQHVTTH